MKNITVVGSNGFIGSALVKGLWNNGYNPITITRDSQIESLNSDIVFYVAGSITPHNAVDQITLIESDLQNLIQFLNRLKNLKSPPLFVFTSSAGTVYDSTGKQPYKESSPLLPHNHYGRSKLDQEKAVQQCEWIKPLVLRLSNIYGPHQQPKPGFGVIAHWAKRIFNQEPIEIMGNSTRDYLNIIDLIDIALKITKTPQSHFAGLTVNIGSGNSTSLNTLYETFVNVVGKPIEIIKRPARTFDANSVSIDISLAKELFNWHPKISLDAGIKGVLETACI